MTTERALFFFAGLVVGVLPVLIHASSVEVELGEAKVKIETQQKTVHQLSTAYHDLAVNLRK